MQLHVRQLECFASSLTKELARPKKYFFICSTNLFLYQYGVKVVFVFIEVWVQSNSLLMLVTYLALSPIFHLQCNQDEDLQAPPQRSTDDTKCSAHDG